MKKDSIIKELIEKKKLNPSFKLTKKYIRETYKVKATEATEIFVAVSQSREDEALLEDDTLELSHQEKIFCLDYLKSYSIKNSAAKAGFTQSEGLKLIKKKRIREGLKALQTKREEELYIQGINIIQMYMSIAFADITDYVDFGTEEVPMVDPYGRVIRDEDGNVKMVTRNYLRLKDSKSIDGRIIQEVKQGRDGVSIKLFDKMAALDKLSKYLDVYNEATTTKLNTELLKTRVEVEKRKLELLGGEDEDFKIIIERADKK